MMLLADFQSWSILTSQTYFLINKINITEIAKIKSTQFCDGGAHNLLKEELYTKWFLCAHFFTIMYFWIKSLFLVTIFSIFFEYNHKKWPHVANMSQIGRVHHLSMFFHVPTSLWYVDVGDQNLDAKNSANFWTMKQFLNFFVFFFTIMILCVVVQKYFVTKYYQYNHYH